METNASKTDKSLKSSTESLVQSKEVGESINLDFILEQAKKDIDTMIKSLEEKSKEIHSTNNMVLKTYLEELRSAKSPEEKQVWTEKVEKVFEENQKQFSKLYEVHWNSLLFRWYINKGLSNKNNKSSLDTNIK